MLVFLECWLCIVGSTQAAAPLRQCEHAAAQLPLALKSPSARLHAQRGCARFEQISRGQIREFLGV